MQNKELSRLEGLFREIEEQTAHTGKKPCIALSVNVRENLNCIAEAYIRSVVLAGGTPILVPALKDTAALAQIMEQVDGLILSGGGDMDPSFFNETLQASPASINVERDEYDLKLVKIAADRQLPIFGICRGFQVLNVAFGGSLYQDIPTHYPLAYLEHDQMEPRHEATQELDIEPNSWLHHLFGKKNICVNTFHHQAIKDLAPIFKVAARSQDGIIEAFEPNGFHAIRGVQFHPECMAAEGNEEMQELLSHFIEECQIYRQAKEMHREIVSIDSHCDTPMFFDQEIDIARRSSPIKIEHDGKEWYESIRVSIPKMQEGKLDAVFMVAYLPQGKRSPEATQQAFEKTKTILSKLCREIQKNEEVVGLARTSKDIVRLKKENKKAILLGIENAYGIGHELSNLKLFKEMGVNYITLSHNGHNDVCDSASEAPEHQGLSEFGRKVVKEMNRLGIMVDISHTSEKTSFDVVELSSYPIIASHSSAKALCDHRRNLSDELMKAIAAKGGVVQVCLYDGFLSRTAKATIMDAVEHIDYIVRTIGIDHVGIGSDFDGGGGIPGVDAANEMINLSTALLRKGYTEAEIGKIWGGNLMRVMDCVQQI